MPSSIAKLNYLRISPRKVRLVADLIRGKSVKEARAILNFVIKKPTLPLLKLLNQAVANAQHNFHLEPDNLYISKIIVNEGPKLKRWRPRARGQVYEIQKKTSHITLVLDEIPAEKKKKIIQKQKESTEVVEKEIKEEKKEIKTKKKTIKPKLKTEKQAKPKIEKTIKKIFRRKSF
ncbi:MAG: 50S ribosomal protein L22 [Minisyncoccales bacterium]